MSDATPEETAVWARTIDALGAAMEGVPYDLGVEAIVAVACLCAKKAGYAKREFAEVIEGCWNDPRTTPTPEPQVQ